MPAANQSTNLLRAAVSVTQMARMLGLSRSRFYDLVVKGIFLPPVYSVATRQPFFLREMQETNLRVKAEQQGALTGEFVLFHERRRPPQVERQGRARRRNEQASGLVQALRSLGLENVDAAAVERAMRTCYPDGTDGQEHAAVLRTVFRHLRRPGGA